jgi:histone-lysine N-methyltransferase SETD3
MQRMLHWLQEEGAAFPSVRIEVGKEGRVVRAAAPIKAGALVMHIPRSLMIGAESAQDSDIGKLIASAEGRLGSYGFMAAYLLDPKREGGPARCYVDVLPKSFPNHPYFFLESELDCLKGFYDLPMLRKWKADMHAEYDRVISCLAEDRAFTREEYESARCAASSRSHGVRIAGKYCTSLIPLADMLDHALDFNVRWRMEATDGFICVAGRDIEAGEVLTTTYGAACNGRLFVTYGFCVENNPHDLAEIQLPELPADHPCVQHAKGLGKERDGMRVFLVQARYDNEDTTRLFSYLRLGALNDASRVSLEKDAKTAAVNPISAENEHAALTLLSQACQQRMAQFDTSIEADEALLKDKSLPLKWRYAVLARHSEKCVLKYFMDLAQAAMPVVQAAAWPQQFREYFERTLPLISAPK